MVNLHRMAASLVKCFQGEAKNLEIPTAQAGETEPADSVEPESNERVLHAPS